MEESKKNIIKKLENLMLILLFLGIIINTIYGFVVIPNVFKNAQTNINPDSVTEGLVVAFGVGFAKAFGIIGIIIFVLLFTIVILALLLISLILYFRKINCKK